jgi:hypothetical protein
MSTIRVMQGVANLTGQRIHTLRIGTMVTRHPQPRYETTCERCGTKGMVGQRDIVTGKARCQFSGCGQELLSEYLADTPRKAAEREAQQKRAALSSAEAQLKQTANAISRTIRERVATGKDDGLYVSLELLSAKMPESEAVKFNKDQAAKFIRDCAEYNGYRSDATLQAIGDYFERNRVRIADSAMILSAFRRLMDYGLIHPNAVPQAEPDAPQEPEPATEPRPEQLSGPGPTVHVGRDPKTGLPKQFTEHEVKFLSADEFARVFPVARTFKDWFIAADEQRGRV